MSVAECDIEWPEYRSVTREEEDLALAYVITAFTDARNIELTLATIFRSLLATQSPWVIVNNPPGRTIVTVFISTLSRTITSGETRKKFNFKIFSNTVKYLTGDQVRCAEDDGLLPSQVPGLSHLPCHGGTDQCCYEYSNYSNIRIVFHEYFYSYLYLLKVDSKIVVQTACSGPCSLYLPACDYRTTAPPKTFLFCTVESFFNFPELDVNSSKFSFGNF